MIEELEFAEERPRLGLRPYQEEALQAVESGWMKFNRQLISMATGLGKCLGKGTPVLLYDGTIIPVEDVKVGMQLMGPDSLPRRVESVCSGREALYRVTPIKGDPYVVNESHILSLKMSGDKYPADTIKNISVQEWFSANKTFRHSAKGWRASLIHFHEKPLHPDMPPYLFGVWLGDGNSRGAGFATVDHEIEQELMEYAKARGLLIRHERVVGKCPMIHIHSGKITGRGKCLNKFKAALRELGVLGAKKIPREYLVNSERHRLELLAGLLDTDGSLADGACFDFISKYQHLSEDVCFIARSLGLAAYMTPCIKKCGQNGVKGTYYRVCISGDTWRIPCRIQRKKAAPRRQKKSVLRTGIRLEAIGVGDYYGFEISGPDRLFLLGDFTVTHNTVLFSHIASREVQRGGRVLILAHTDELLEQARDKLFRATGLISDKEKADEMASQSAKVVVASVQTLSRKTRLMGFRDDHFSLVIVDEAHRSLAESYQRILRYFHFGAHAVAEEWEMPPPDLPTIHKAKILGVTATPDRGDKRSLGEFFQGVAYEYGLLQGVRDGYLVRPIVRNVPIKIDLKGIKRIAGDLSAEDLAIRITPFLKAIASAIKTEAGNRKTVVFTPSVETARLVAEACRENGLLADFVSGGCTDRDHKIAAFDKGPAGSVIACAMLLVEGWDCDTASCVCILRPTKIRSMFVQAVGRTTRPLSGLIDRLSTAEERVEAIAKSAKPNCMILDPLWLSDNLELIRPVDLVITKKEIREKIEDLDGDLISEAEKAERDLLKSLEKAAKKHSRKTSRTVDPLVFAVNVGDNALKEYTPVEPWEATAPDQDQINFLKENGIDTSQVLCRGHAAKIMERLKSRKNLGLCTPKQMNFLIKMGISENEAALTSFDNARKIIYRRVSSHRWH